MPQYDWLVLMVMGGVFILLGVVTIIRGRRDEKSYYDSISTRRDTREFLEHRPHWPQFGGLKIGGRIAITLGVLMIAIGVAFRLWG